MSGFMKAEKGLFYGLAVILLVVGLGTALLLHLHVWAYLLMLVVFAGIVWLEGHFALSGVIPLFLLMSFVALGMLSLNLGRPNQQISFSNALNTQVVHADK
ncbi:hypothetical protein AYR62_13345 [Secundilactobacillus paracollinoides]|uniref:hypothetical protein n=1 Tax=Secundilactobacillus paracollinoides TaxID=240427 RepID=UPI0006D2AF5A|nr:hypothetical protein [Secundilactobacillus paracollinoides]ANZ64961.1 hypothetical protein AYR62_13345 [Secundilactobacillus paracollinoides]KRL78875.1 hypothetical protein FC17_GL000892 [Secundilactobacillus paracollinoides DSM 15502 = JCM 11969]